MLVNFTRVCPGRDRHDDRVSSSTKRHLRTNISSLLCRGAKSGCLRRRGITHGKKKPSFPARLNNPDSSFQISGG
jgi:hypothetical protein